MALKLYSDSSVQDIANAIRSKNGTQTTYKIGEMAAAIQAIPTGGCPVEAPDNEVIYIDYDGTILYSYSASEYLALSAHPANPSHDGLTAEGWNYTLQEAQAYVRDNGALTIGQTYITDDGKTRFHITIPETTDVKRMKISGNYMDYAQKTVTVDWGDGTIEATTQAYGLNLSHEYAAAGDYVISIETPADKSLLFQSTFGTGTSGTIQTDSYMAASYVRRIHLGANLAGIGISFARYCVNLEAITIPAYITSIANYTFDGCPSLRAFVVAELPTLPSGALNQAGVRYISGKISLTGSGMVSYENRYLRRLESHTASISRTLMQCSAACVFDRLTIARGIETISSAFFTVYYSPIRTFTIPDTVTAIDSSAFISYVADTIIMLPTTPPTIQSASFNLQRLAKIVIPYSADHSVLYAYQNATNWATYAAKMIEAPAP